LVIESERAEGAFCPSKKAIEVMGFQEHLSEVWTVIPIGPTSDSFGSLAVDAREEQ
jgi:hypothetical protein